MPLQVTVEEPKDTWLHEEGEWYTGTLNNIEEFDGEYGPGYKFIIHLDDEFNQEGEPRETWAFTGQKITPKTKLGRWAKGLGYDLTAGTNINLEEIINTSVAVEFEHVPGFDKDGQAITKERVVKMKKGTGTKTTPAEDLEAPF